jgi:hypothetical protein
MVTIAKLLSLSVALGAFAVSATGKPFVAKSFRRTAIL